MSGSNIWDQILSVFETRINRHIFFTWFRAVSFKSEGDGVLQVSVPCTLFRDWFLIRYAPVVDEALAHIGRGGMSVSYIVEPTAPARYPSPFAGALRPEQ
jgi:chromosomal replication initiation ATPase DnaA